jgi:ABC-type nitrate/sulfonate/bicarbonate transport system permease component
MFKQEQITSPNRRRSKLSQVLAGTALALFSILVIDTIMSQGGLGFLSMDTRYKGPIFGISSEILFFASFGIGYKQRSRLASLLLLA